MSTAVTAGVPSPCINVCRMNDGSGLCEGCLRTLDEIAAWGGLDDTRKRAVLVELRLRQQRWREAQQGAAALAWASAPPAAPT